MRCKGCGRQYRSGTTVYVCNEDGALQRARVCKHCDVTAVRILMQPVLPLGCSCGAPAAKCAVCVAKLEKQAALKASDAKALAKKLHGLAEAQRNPILGQRHKEYRDGFADGLEAAKNVVLEGKP